MQSKNPFDQFDGPTQRGVVVKQADPRRPYEGPMAQAELAAKRQEAELRSLTIEEKRRKLNGGSDLPPPPGDLNKTGDEYLATIPQGIRPVVQSVLDGRQSPPPSFAMAKPYWQQVVSAANQADPTFDQSQWKSRVALRSAYSSQGKSTPSAVINSINTLAAHANTMYENHLHMAGPNLGPFSGLAAGTMQSFDQKYTPGYNTELSFVQGEVQKLVKNGAASEGEAKIIMNNLRGAQSFEARGSAIKALVDMAEGKIGPVRDGWRAVFGDRPMPTDVTPSSMAVFDNIKGDGHSALKTDRFGTPVVPGAGGGLNNTYPIGGPPNGPPPGSSPPGSGGPQGGGGPAMPPVGFGQNFAPTGGASGSNELATGQSAQRRDPQTNALINSMIRSGASPAAINAKLASIGKGGADPKAITDSQEYLRNNPNYKGSFADATILSPTTAMNRFSASPLGAGLTAASDAINPFASDFSNNRDEFRQLHALLRAQHPYASVAGDLVGGTAAAMALEGGAGALASRFFAPVAGETAAALQAAKATRGIQISRAGDAAYGAASGVGNADDGNRLIGGAVGAVSGLGGGMLGRTATRGVSAVTRGVTDASVNYLRNAGVPLTFGQAAGGTAKWLEDRASSFIPSINARRGEGVKGVVDAAFNQGVSSIPGQINAPTGPQMVEQGKALVKNAFSGALDGRSIPVDTGAGSPWAAEIAKGAGTPTYGSDFSALIADHADPLLANGSLSGQDFQKLDRTLAGNARAYGNIGQGTPTTPPAPMATRVGQSFNNLGDILDNSVHAAAPDIIPQYDAAKSAFRHIGILRDAVDQARNGSASGVPGLPTPAQINTAASRNAKQFGGTQGTTEVPFYKLTEAAQNVLPSRVPDSGTAGRLLVAGGLGALGSGVGAGLGYTGGDTAGGAGAGLGYTAAGLGVGSLLYSKTAQKLAVEALLRRSGMMGRIAGKVDNVSPYAGMLGTAGGAAATPYLLGSN
jgi:hypothetical protein